MAIEFKDFAKLKWYYQVLITAAVCGGLLALVWYQFLAQMQTDIQARQTRLEELQKTVAKSLQQQKILAQFKQDAIRLEAEIDQLKTKLPQEKETDQVLRSVQSTASSSALRILSVGFQTTIDHDVYTEWPIRMEVVATYHNIGTFLDKIRQLPRIVNISGLKVQSRASEGEAAFTQSVGATYTATTFVYKEEPPLPAAPPAKK